MAITSRFVALERIHTAVEGCPLRRPVPSDDEGPCGTCAYNAVNPGSPRIGCIVHTPKSVYDTALARLAQRDPELRDQFRRQMHAGGGRAATTDEAAGWLSLAERWFTLLRASGDADPTELELAGVLARFSEAGKRLGEAVQLLR